MSRDSAAQSGHRAVHGRATDVREQGKQDAESVGSARTNALGKKWSRLEKSGPGWKKMDFT